MPAFISNVNPTTAGCLPPQPSSKPNAQMGHDASLGREILHPNALVQTAFFLSIFCVPFVYLYLPGTGGRLGILRIIQILVLCGIFLQPKVCLRLVPKALFWLLGYISVRIIWGFCLTPEKQNLWWPSSREFMEVLPWVLVMFNVLQFPGMPQLGLWALALGCSMCAICHIAGIGVSEVANGLDNRSSVFGVNANEMGSTYAAAIIALVGLWLRESASWKPRLLSPTLIILIGIAMAKTGSRTAILILAMGVGVLFIFGKSYGPKIKRLMCLLAMMALVALILWIIPTTIERFKEINPQNIGELNPRARMAPVLWEMFLRSPLYGLGPDGYEAELTRRAMPYLINEGMLIAAHNLLLLLLVETGIIGALLFSGGVGSALLAAWRGRHKSGGPLPLALLLPFIVAGVTLSNPIHGSVFWVAIAYALAGVA